MSLVFGSHVQQSAHASRPPSRNVPPPRRVAVSGDGRLDIIVAPFTVVSTLHVNPFVVQVTQAQTDADADLCIQALCTF